MKHEFGDGPKGRPRKRRSSYPQGQYPRNSGDTRRAGRQEQVPFCDVDDDGIYFDDDGYDDKEAKRPSDAADAVGQDVDEDVRRPRGPLSFMPDLAYAQPAFWCFVIFVIASYLNWQTPYGAYLWAGSPAVFGKGEYWRLVTSLCTHGDGGHLLSNAPFFLIFGWFLRAYFGFAVFPLATFLVGIITTGITIALSDPQMRLIGASGMIYGMVALWLIFYVRFDEDHPVPMRIVRAVGFVLIMLFPTVYEPQVSYLAHAVGFAVGFVAGLALLPFVRVRIAPREDAAGERHD